MPARILSLAIILGSAVVLFSQVTNLKAEFRKGKTYITFSEETGGNHAYKIYRSTSPITVVSDMAAYTTLRDSSSYDYGWRRYWTVTDTGTPLTSATGLLVYTPKETAEVYYAATIVRGGVEDKTISPGSNALLTPVHEEWWKWPGGVLQEIDLTSYYLAKNYRYYYWMDYDDWNHDYCYYGDLFAIGVNNAVQSRMNTGAPQPLSVGLHSAFQDGYTSGVSSGNSTEAAILGFRSHALPFNNQTWWYGWAKGWKFTNPPGDSSLNTPARGDTIVNYAEMRIQAYIHAVLGETRFRLDTNRIYLSGVSMGGSGSLINAVHHPETFAAVHGIVPAVKFQYCWYFGSAANKWGAPSDSLTARNGVYIYDWNDAGWVAGRDAVTAFPVMLVASGCRDSGMPLWMHRWLYFNCAKSRQGVFGLWKNVGHETINDQPVAGGMMRFRRDECFPAFSNASRDDDYGQHYADKNSPPAGTLPFTDMVFDTAGVMNGYLDWTSSLHDMGMADDSLIDCADSLRITLKTGRESTFVDITPRRIQRFPVTQGLSYDWRNISTATGTVSAQGTVEPDTHGLLTVPSFLVLTTGSRLVITPAGGAHDEMARAALAAGFTVSPNPVRSSAFIRLTRAVKSIAIADVRGRIVARPVAQPGGFSWDAAGSPAGVYTVCVKTEKGDVLTKRITVLK